MERKARPKRPNFSTHMPYAAPAFADIGGKCLLALLLPGPVLRLRLGTVFRRIVLKMKMNFDFSKKEKKKLQMLRHLPSDFSFNHKLCNALDTF